MRDKHLILRGRTYSWRGRLKSRLAGSAASSHFCLSLGTHDPTIAERMARRLTLLRDELISGQKNTLTQEMVKLVLVRARDEMTERVENSKGVAVRRGEAADPADLVSDLTMGWCYRLMETYGPSHKNFDGMKTWLSSNGAPGGLIDSIVEQYQWLRQRWMPDQKNPILNQLIEEFSLPDTLLTRSRLQIALFSGRADALLDTVGRYPAVDTGPQSQFARLVMARKSPNTDAGTELAADTVPAPAVEPAVPETAPNHLNEPETPKPAASSSPRCEPATRLPVRDMTETACRGWKSALSDDMRIGIDLNAPAENLEAFRQIRQAIVLFERVLDHAGIEYVDQVSQEHVAHFRRIMDSLNRNWGRGFRKGQSYPTLAQLLSTAEQRAKSGEKPGLDVSTIRRHMGSLNEAFKYLAAQGFRPAHVDVRLLTPPKKKADARVEFQPLNGLADTQGGKIPAAEISAFTHLPLYTGCAGPAPRQMAVPGDQFFHCGLTWIPLVLLYSGARRGEIAAMEVDDVVKGGPTPYIGVRRILEGRRGRGLKNENSRRAVPLHSELIRLGFLDYADAIKSLGHKKLFPELYNPDRPRQDMGDVLYKQLQKIISKSPGDYKAHNRFFHAMRATFSNELKQVGIAEEFRSELAGHRVGGVNSAIYTDDARVELKSPLMEKFEAVTGHLNFGEVRLLPWVIKMAKSPWFDD